MHAQLAALAALASQLKASGARVDRQHLALRHLPRQHDAPRVDLKAPGTRLLFSPAALRLQRGQVAVSGPRGGQRPCPSDS